MPDIEKLVATLMASENQDRAMKMRIQGGGGYDNSGAASLLSGGGRATLDIGRARMVQDGKRKIIAVNPALVIEGGAS